MGAWGTGIFSDDLALDIKSEYNDLLAYFSDEEAEKKIFEDFGEILNTDEASVFWFALALSEWKKGRLSEQVKWKAIEWIDSGEDLLVWKESGEKQHDKRKAVLEKLRATLLAEQPARKVIRRPVFARSPWQAGDLLAYQLTDKNLKYEELLGKYVLLRVVEIKKEPIARYIPDSNYYESIIFGLYNWYGEAIPELDIVKNLKYIPIVVLTKYSNDLSQHNSIAKRLGSDPTKYNRMYLSWFLYRKTDLKEIRFVYLGKGSDADIEVKNVYDTRMHCGIDRYQINYHICCALRSAGLV